MVRIANFHGKFYGTQLYVEWRTVCSPNPVSPDCMSEASLLDGLTPLTTYQCLLELIL